MCRQLAHSKLDLKFSFSTTSARLEEPWQVTTWQSRKEICLPWYHIFAIYLLFFIVINYKQNNGGNKLKKINYFLLGFVLLTTYANAQSVSDMFNSIKSFPNEKEVLAQLKSNKPFEAQLKALNDNIEKYEKAFEKANGEANEEELNNMKELGVDENTTQEDMLSKMNISQSDLSALENMDDNNPAKIALAMKMMQNYNNSDFMKKVTQQNMAKVNRMNGLPENFRGGELTDEQSSEMEKRSELMQKVSEYKIELMTQIRPVFDQLVGSVENFNSDYEDDEKIMNKISNLEQDKTDYNNRAATLAAINKYNRESHALYCELAAKKISKRMELIKNGFNKLKSYQKKLEEMDKAFVQFNKNMNNKMENINEAREMLIEFSKLYKASLEDDVPMPLKQYKTWKEYEELLAY